MKLESYWLDTAAPFSSGAQGAPHGNADVVVVGAGFTGLSAALALAKKGASVVVLEAGLVANAASGRNGGMCNNGFAQDYYQLSTKLGRERANMLYRAFDAGVDKVEAIIAEERIECDFKRVGKLKLAAKPEHYDKLVRSQALLAEEVDPDTRLVPRTDLRAEIGSDRYFGGLLFEKSAGMHVGKFGQGSPRRPRAEEHRSTRTARWSDCGGSQTTRTRSARPMAVSERARCSWLPGRRRSARSAGFAVALCPSAPSSSPLNRCQSICSID